MVPADPENEPAGATSLLHLLYVSTSRTRLDDETLEQILDKAQHNNARLGVTGLLIYCDGNFMQMIEGPDATVTALFETIQGDARHFDVHEILRIRSPDRWFAEWAMAYVRGVERSEMTHCIDLARAAEGIDPVLHRSNPLRDLLNGFIASNQR